jgi:hypothetical protein
MIELQLGLAHVFARNDEPATLYLKHGLDRARELADPWLVSYALALQGIHAGLLDRRLEGIRLLNEALSLSEQTGESFQGTFWLLNLAVQQYHVDASASAEAFVRCARRAIEDDNLRAVAGCFEGIGWCLQAGGEREAAARFLGAAEELRVRTSQPLLPQWLPAHDEATRALAQTEFKAACERAWSAGAEAVRQKQYDQLYSEARSLLASEAIA